MIIYKKTFINLNLNKLLSLKKKEFDTTYFKNKVKKEFKSFSFSSSYLIRLNILNTYTIVLNDWVMATF